MTEKDGFLDRMVGSWDLRGSMGSIPLHQAVQGSWVLDGRFLELRFREVDGHLYEAIYYMGHNRQQDLYVLHLLDTTGVSASPADSVGIGRREGEVIPFLFADETEPFTNRLEWHPAEDAWTFDLTYVRDAEVQTFATKRMTRCQ